MLRLREQASGRDKLHPDDDGVPQSLVSLPPSARRSNVQHCDLVSAGGLLDWNGTARLARPRPWRQRGDR
jgi:hypothetical protein